MTSQPVADEFSAHGGAALTKRQSEQHLAIDLIKVLRPHRQGLRRWSVMRAIRARHEAVGQDIPQKLEDNVERVFRRFCAETDGVRDSDAVFYRPQDRAGEVWAVYAERADAWLEAEGESR